MPPVTIEEAIKVAVEHQQAGRLTEAEAIYRQILTVAPRHAPALHYLGVLAHQAGKSDQAIDLIEKAIELSPASPVFYSNLGEACRGAGQLDRAIAAYQNAIRLKPDYALAHGNLGAAFYDNGELDHAIAVSRKAIQLKPDYAQAYNVLGNALKDQGNQTAAVAAYVTALQLKPDFPDAYINLGNALADQGRLDEAIAAYRKAIRLKPDSAEAYTNLGVALKDQGELDDAIIAYGRAIQIKPSFAGAHSALLYALHFHPGYDAQSIYQQHQRWNQMHAEPLRHLIRPHTNDRSPDRRLKIGYVSADFREHPVGRFILALLGAHDHENHEIFAYSHVSRPDSLTTKLRSFCDHWRDIVRHSNEKVAAQIRADRIDILVDLTLHMANDRLLLFALKPAPVQVTYLGYAGTTGLTTIDYRLTDPSLDPPGINDAYYSEQSFRLPQTYWCYAPSRPDIQVSPLPALQAEHRRITFGSLNNFCKITKPTLERWCDLLRQVPGSRLILHAYEGSHRQKTWDLLEREGIDRGRLSFLGRLPLDDYYRAYHAIDIALDPFPYAGGTTTCDALWMGVPVASLCGKTAVARGGWSLLSNLGLPELVAHSQEEYVHIAVKLAGDLLRLAELRESMRRRMEASPLMNAPRFARGIEDAYRQMWRTWCG